MVDNFILSSIDNPNYESYWSDGLFGVQFRFDNGTYYVPSGNQVIVGDATISDTTLWHRIGFRIRYKTNLTEYYARPNYTYKTMNNLHLSKNRLIE